MLNNTTSTPDHVFISYPRASEDYALELWDRLRSLAIPVWVDKENLKPGTTNWQNSIRLAIKDSIAVIIIASPDTSKSVYVEAEIAIARNENKPIFPVWVTGENWIDCIPLDIVGYQYIDCRGDFFEHGIQELIINLQKHFREQRPSLFLIDDNHQYDSYPYRFSIILSSPNDQKLRGKQKRTKMKEVVSVYAPAYSSFQSLLDEIYMRFLRDRYPPYSYGKFWILGKYDAWLNELIVPWGWITNRESITKLDPIWSSSSLDKLHLIAGSTWVIYDLKLNSMFVFGIAATDNRLASMDPNSLAKRFLTSYYYDWAIEPIMRKIDPQMVKPENYQTSCIFTCEPKHLTAMSNLPKGKYAAFIQE